MIKHRLRSILKARRNALSVLERSVNNTTLHAHLFASEMWQQAHIIHCYCSFGSEADTWHIINTAFAQGKRVIVPLTPATNTSNYTSELLHTEIIADTSFMPDAFGIPTPQGIHMTESGFAMTVNPASILAPADCVIVPLLGFDTARHRIGYGHGFYDRFLQTLIAYSSEPPQCIGIGFWCQCVAEGLPVEAHDVQLDAIFTEFGLLP
jgi:5-formyltetrahydrofolate cyclo-ligase